MGVSQCFYETPTTFKELGVSDRLYFHFRAEESERLPFLEGTFEADYNVDRGLVKPYYEDKYFFLIRFGLSYTKFRSVAFASVFFL